MTAVLPSISVCIVFAAALHACSAVAADIRIPVVADSRLKYSMTERDQLQIRRLISALGICQPISTIDMDAAHRATVNCGPIDAHPKKGRDLGHWIQVTLVRKHGRWSVDRSSIRMTERLWGM